MLIRRATLLDAPAIAKVNVMSWRETYPGIVPQSHLDNLSIDKRQDIWRQAIEQGRFVSVAENEGEVIGFADGGKFCGQHPNIVGELYAIYVLAAYHRKGLGRKLFDSIQQFLDQNNLLPFAIWALADNPACHFYKAMGGKMVDEKWVDIGNIALKEFLFAYE